METDFIYWRHDTPVGIRIEEVCGAEDRKGKVWLMMARQVYCENGRESYRVIGHFDSGAPYLDGSDARISIAHTEGLLVVASLPRTPEAPLETFSPRAALGVDVERLDRSQACRVRERFLSPDEQSLVAPDDVEGNVLAWTCKEALLKAGLNPGVDIRHDLIIHTLPDPRTGATGRGAIVLNDTPDFTSDKKSPAADLKSPTGGIRKRIEDMELYSYISEGCIVTLAYSPRCSKFKRN